MADNSKKKGFFSNWSVRNLLIAVAVVAVLVIGAMVFLNLVTQHNKELAVPDGSRAETILCSMHAFLIAISILLYNLHGIECGRIACPWLQIAETLEHHVKSL
mgnify:CR=1 FL=1